MLARLADGLLSYLPLCFGSSAQEQNGESLDLILDHDSKWCVYVPAAGAREAAFVGVLCDNGKTARSLWLVCTRGFCPPALSQTSQGTST